MKKIFIVIALIHPFIHSMSDSPEKVISNNIKNPLYVRELLRKFSPQQLRDYKDSNFNNLMHITIRELIKNADSQDFARLIEECKPLLLELARAGVDVNEVNNDRRTPSSLAYGNTNTYDLAEYFLVPNLGAHITYASLQPEYRAFKKILYNCFCGCCKRKQKEL